MYVLLLIGLLFSTDNSFKHWHKNKNGGTNASMNGAPICYVFNVFFPCTETVLGKSSAFVCSVNHTHGKS